jgi:hypothetical protein
MGTGAAARRGHAAVRRSHRRTHPCEAAAHQGTAQRAVTAIPVWSSLVDAGVDAETAAHPAVLRASEELDARSTG